MHAHVISRPNNEYSDGLLAITLSMLKVEKIVWYQNVFLAMYFPTSQISNDNSEL